MTTQAMRAPHALYALSDTLAMTKRNLLKYVRVPDLLLFSTVQPVMFTLLFIYVFGGALQIPRVGYADFLMPGIFVQTTVFGSLQTGIGLADDLSKGMVDRFRSLPMARSAVLAGRTLSDTVRNVFVLLLMTGVGYAVGFSFHAGFARAVAALVLALLFGLAFSWISALIGLLVGDVEAAQAASFVWVFPLVFASSVFVPVGSMPDWLQHFAANNPITLTVDALRDLTLGGGTMSQLGMGNGTLTDVWQSLAWIGGILVLFAPLAVQRYRKVA